MINVDAISFVEKTSRILQQSIYHSIATIQIMRMLRLDTANALSFPCRNKIYHAFNTDRS